jgi:hypothetical protein
MSARIGIMSPLRQTLGCSSFSSFSTSNLGMREWDDYDYEDEDEEELNGSWSEFLAGLAKANRISGVEA